MLASLTFDIPQELAIRLRPVESQIGHILELGLRELNASAQAEFAGAVDVLEFLANLPSPEEILALRPTPAFQARISGLLEKNRTTGLNSAEQQEWAQYQYVEHLVRMAKAKAYAKLHHA